LTVAEAAVFQDGVAAAQSDAARPAPGTDIPEPHTPSSTPAPSDAPPEDNRYLQALQIAVGRGDQISEKLKELVSPENIALMTAFAAAYVAAQATPAGWFADGVAVAGLLMSALFIGKELFTVVDDIRTFVRLCDSPSGDLQEAGKRLAHAIATVGVDTILILLTHKAGNAAKPYIKPPSGFVDVVTPDGKIVRVPEKVAADPAVQTRGSGSSGGSGAGTRTWTLDPARTAERDALATEKGEIIPKGGEEAEGIMQVMDEGKTKFEGKPRRADTKAGEPDHDYVIEKDGKVTGYVEIKTPVGKEVRPIAAQAENIGTKIVELRPDAKTQIVVNLKNLADADKGAFLEGLKSHGVDLNSITILNPAPNP